ncbi:hypothetical protein HJFPF1_02288 [Paramyrothecium foliicola]|nr:hypothetical protein HJFPF1_02288 [Paramyrothecium foliicola]
MSSPYTQPPPLCGLSGGTLMSFGPKSAGQELREYGLATIRITPVTQVEGPFVWAPEEEAEWRAEYPAWNVKDFFKLLKRQFLRSNFVPINIYRYHGLPNLWDFRKEDCLQAVKALLREEFPEFVDELPKHDDVDEGDQDENGSDDDGKD